MTAEFREKRLRFSPLTAIILVITLLLAIQELSFIGNVYAHPVTVDGSCIDWTGEPPEKDNEYIIDEGEWIWRDAANDEITFFSKPDPSVDIIEVRVTGNQTFLFIMVKFKDLSSIEIGKIGSTYLAITIDVDTVDRGGEWIGYESDTSVKARWEYQIIVNLASPQAEEGKTLRLGESGSDPFILYKYERGESKIVDPFSVEGALNASTAVNLTTSVIEIQLPWEVIGGIPKRNPLRFTCASARGWAFKDKGCTKEVGGPERSDILDCVSDLSSGEELRDNCIGYYFKIYFNEQGEPVKKAEAPSPASWIFIIGLILVLGKPIYFFQKRYGIPYPIVLLVLVCVVYFGLPQILPISPLPEGTPRPFIDYIVPVVALTALIIIIVHSSFDTAIKALRKSGKEESNVNILTATRLSVVFTSLNALVETIIITFIFSWLLGWNPLHAALLGIASTGSSTIIVETLTDTIRDEAPYTREILLYESIINDATILGLSSLILYLIEKGKGTFVLEQAYLTEIIIEIVMLASFIALVLLFYKSLNNMITTIKSIKTKEELYKAVPSIFGALLSIFGLSFIHSISTWVQTLISMIFNLFKLTIFFLIIFTILILFSNYKKFHKGVISIVFLGLSMVLYYFGEEAMVKGLGIFSILLAGIVTTIIIFYLRPFIRYAVGFLKRTRLISIDAHIENIERICKFFEESENYFRGIVENINEIKIYMAIIFFALLTFGFVAIFAEMFAIGKISELVNAGIYAVYIIIITILVRYLDLFLTWILANKVWRESERAINELLRKKHFTASMIAKGPLTASLAVVLGEYLGEYKTWIINVLFIVVFLSALVPSLTLFYEKTRERKKKLQGGRAPQHSKASGE